MTHAAPEDSCCGCGMALADGACPRCAEGPPWPPGTELPWPTLLESPDHFGLDRWPVVVRGSRRLIFEPCLRQQAMLAVCGALYQTERLPLDFVQGLGLEPPPPGSRWPISRARALASQTLTVRIRGRASTAPSSPLRCRGDDAYGDLAAAVHMAQHLGARLQVRGASPGTGIGLDLSLTLLPWRGHPDCFAAPTPVQSATAFEARMAADFLRNL